MDRKAELLQVIPADSLQFIGDVVDEIVFLEERLEELKQLPFIQVHPHDKSKQRATPAAKQYKEFLQQYINCIKLIESVVYKDKKLTKTEVEDSPLRKWFKAHTA